MSEHTHGTPRIPFLSAICPTYKRPELLANAVACWESQDYPLDRRELVILDDAGQFDDGQTGPGWRLVSRSARIPSLWEKFNELVRMTRGSVIVVWEDDDVYLPWHLSAIADAWRQNYLCHPGMLACPQYQFLIPGRIFTNCGLPRGQVKEEPQRTGHHGSWAYTRGLFQRVGGYDPTPGQLGGDLEFGRRLRSAGEVVKYAVDTPTYVYRWNPAAQYHGSQRGPAGFAALWEDLGRQPAPFIGRLEPRFDAETLLLRERWAPARGDAPRNPPLVNAGS